MQNVENFLNIQLVISIKKKISQISCGKNLILHWLIVWCKDIRAYYTVMMCNVRVDRVKWQVLDLFLT